MTVKAVVHSPLQLFLLLLGEATLTAIVLATNAYASLTMERESIKHVHPRPWHPLTRNELIV